MKAHLASDWINHLYLITTDRFLCLYNTGPIVEALFTQQFLVCAALCSVKHTPVKASGLVRGPRTLDMLTGEATDPFDNWMTPSSNVDTERMFPTEQLLLLSILSSSGAEAVFSYLAPLYLSQH